ncbi:hypothetical protein BURK2_03548 [Burkholderiales bacterium]|nr:MAG: hypothetical protein F9K47_04880 [Burkholderiales bacterium]CAG1007035.1 hypothetical protein BURK2_03548 [Burkholderiales bacterium]
MAERKCFLQRIRPQLWAEIERLAQAELCGANGQIEYLPRKGMRARQAPAAAADQRKRERPRDNPES